jgi:hypothetical protein
LAGEGHDFRFGEVVFFGRSIEEYVSMFDLALDAMQGMKILDCPGGPAAFASQAAARNIAVTACDPLYAESDVEALRAVVDTHAQNVARKQVVNRALFHPELTPTSVRREAMELFLHDYIKGKSEGRYVYGQLPKLPFDDLAFDLVLSANLLFIYSDTICGGMLEHSPFDYEFHKRSIDELLRVSKQELRIYPLKGPGTGVHQFLQPLTSELEGAGYHVSIRNVAQRDIIGAEQMMVIRR